MCSVNLGYRNTFKQLHYAEEKIDSVFDCQKFCEEKEACGCFSYKTNGYCRLGANGEGCNEISEPTRGVVNDDQEWRWGYCLKSDGGNA